LASISAPSSFRTAIVAASSITFESLVTPRRNAPTEASTRTSLGPPPSPSNGSPKFSSKTALTPGMGKGSGHTVDEAFWVAEGGGAAAVVGAVAVGRATVTGFASGAVATGSGRAAGVPVRSRNETTTPATMMSAETAASAMTGARSEREVIGSSHPTSRSRRRR
jgi:hypothetical protein